MKTTEKEDKLEYFGQRLMKSVRDYTFRELHKTMIGEMKPESSKALFEKINRFNAEAKEVIEETAKKFIDNALNNFLWLLEQEESIDLKGETLSGESFSLRDYSDGLCGDYHDWVEKYSEYPPLRDELNLQIERLQEELNRNRFAFYEDTHADLTQKVHGLADLYCKGKITDDKTREEMNKIWDEYTPWVKAEKWPSLAERKIPGPHKLP